MEPGMVKPIAGMVDAAVQESKSYADGLLAGLGSRVATLEKDNAALATMVRQLADSVAGLCGAVTMLNDAVAGKVGKKS